MAGIPAVISDGPWWGIFLFLTGVVFCRAQATYWAGWWLRKGVASGAKSASLDDVAGEAEASPEHRPTRRARIAARFSGPTWDKAQAFLDRWGFVGIPVSFLTVGFQTMVNAAAGFTRMRWDLYTLAMIPGCLAWAAIYASLGVGLVEAWKTSPWLFIGILVGLVALAWLFTAVRRASAARRAAT